MPRMTTRGTPRCATRGLDSRHRHWSDDAIRASLGAFWARTGRLPRAAELRDSGWSGPCAGTLRRRYGSVSSAWRMLAPVPLDERTGDGAYSRAETGVEAHGDPQRGATAR
jgi:hypothetical protein